MQPPQTLKAYRCRYERLGFEEILNCDSIDSVLLVVNQPSRGEYTVPPGLVIDADNCSPLSSVASHSKTMRTRERNETAGAGAQAQIPDAC
jgi:hypothetical protein